MKKETDFKYSTASDWLKANRNELVKFAGEWVAISKTGIFEHDKSGQIVAQKARKSQIDYTLKYVHPYEVSKAIRILPIRIRTLKNNKWQPDYSISLGTSKITENLTMLVDSGADISIIPKWTGQDLGLQLAEDEYIEKAEGVNGTIDYVIRNLTFNIDGHSFKAPVGWVQTESVEDILIGREVVFDLFDIEFKQSDEVIIFKKREIES